MYIFVQTDIGYMSQTIYLTQIPVLIQVYDSLIGI